MTTKLEQQTRKRNGWAALAVMVLIVRDNFFDLHIKDGYNYATVLGNWYFGRAGPTKVIAGQ